MTTGSTPEQQEVDRLIEQIVADAPDPAMDEEDFDRLTTRALTRTLAPSAPAFDLTELRVRMAGAGVSGHSVGVHDATRMLNTLQAAVTEAGSAVRRQAGTTHATTSITRATQLTISPEQVAPGSVIFFLEHRRPRVEHDAAQLTVDSIVDQASQIVFDTLELVRGDDIRGFREQLRRMGPDFAVKVNRLARLTLSTDIDLDLGLLTPTGRRSHAWLRHAEAERIEQAVEPVQEQEVSHRVIGVVRTAADGIDMARISRIDDEDIKATVPPHLAEPLGQLMHKGVEAQIKTTTT